MACELTLQQAFETYYRPHADIAPATIEKYQVSLGHWAQKTGDPQVDQVTNATVAEFRSKMIAAGFSAATIRGCWGQLRTIFRLLGPQEFRNPFGHGLIDRIPAMRSVREDRDPPYRIPLDDISRTYRAADTARWPINGIPAPDLWRTLLIVAYTTGLRRDDLKALRWEKIDLRAGTIAIRASKTGKSESRRLHPAAIEHLQRIYRPSEQVFYGLPAHKRNSNNGNLYKTFKKIQRTGQVKRLFSLHDIRRTGGSEIERVAPGVGKVFLQHTPTNVSDISYLNRIDELNEAVLKMRMPDAFVGRMPHPELPPLRDFDADDAATADFPQLNHGTWEFRPGAFRLCLRWFTLHFGVSLSILRAFAESDRPLSIDDVAKHLNRPDISRSRISARVGKLREHLAIELDLPRTVDPLPLVQTRPAAWALYLPDYVLQRVQEPTAEQRKSEWARKAELMAAGSASRRQANTHSSFDLPFAGVIA